MELLLGKQVLPVLILALALLAGALDGGLLLVKLPDLLFEHLRLVTLL